jgi:TatD DNase family protein
MAFEIFDIGANLTNKAFNSDRESVIDRAISARVTKIVVTASGISSAGDALALARTRPGILYSTAGVHPHDVRFCDENTLSSIRSLVRESEVVAIGECGLDFNRNFSQPATQEHWFTEQVSLACDLKKPLFLHEREAHDRFIGILDEFSGRLPAVLVHCFTGTKHELHAYLDRGFHIGITGWICDERRGLHLTELVKDIPADRLMIETDAPYLVPRTMHPKPRNSRNEPAFLTYVLETIAKSGNRDIETVALETFATSIRFFNIQV